MLSSINSTSYNRGLIILLLYEKDDDDELELEIAFVRAVCICGNKEWIHR